MSDLGALFDPAAVAVIGASSDPDRIGGRPLRFLREAGFKPPLYAVNRTAAKCRPRAYTSVLDLGAVDHAVVCVPVPAVRAAADECIRKRVPRGADRRLRRARSRGRTLQDEIVAMCRTAGVRMVGRTRSACQRAHGSVRHVLDLARRRCRCRGRSRSPPSGASARAPTAGDAARPRLKIVATGNEADVDVAECIGFLAGDSASRVILAALESCRDGVISPRAAEGGARRCR